MGSVDQIHPIRSMIPFPPLPNPPVLSNKRVPPATSTTNPLADLDSEAADGELAVDQRQHQGVALERHLPKDDDLGEQEVGPVLCRRACV